MACHRALSENFLKRELARAEGQSDQKPLATGQSTQILQELISDHISGSSFIFTWAGLHCGLGFIVAAVCQILSLFLPFLELSGLFQVWQFLPAYQSAGHVSCDYKSDMTALGH